MSGDASALVDDAIRGGGQRAPAQDRTPTPKRSDALLHGERVSVADDHMLNAHAQLLGDDLGEAGLVALPCELDPVYTVISPVRSTRMLPLSKPAPPLGSTNVDS